MKTQGEIEAAICEGMSRFQQEYMWAAAPRTSTLALTGALDNISVVVRHTMVQLATPNEMRGRVSAVNAMFISSSNELGGFESGAVAHFFGPVISVVSGGIGTIAIVLAWTGLFPNLRKVGRLAEH